MNFKMLNTLRNGDMVSAEVDIPDENRRAWVGVYPIDDGGSWKFRIRYFEVELQHLEDDNDVWEETMLNKRDQWVESEKELLESLPCFIDNIDRLGPPWKCAYPV